MMSMMTGLLRFVHLIRNRYGASEVVQAHEVHWSSVEKQLLMQELQGALWC